MSKTIGGGVGVFVVSVIFLLGLVNKVGILVGPGMKLYIELKVTQIVVLKSWINIRYQNIVVRQGK